MYCNSTVSTTTKSRSTRNLGKNTLKRRASSSAIRNKYLCKLGMLPLNECSMRQRQGHLDSRTEMHQHQSSEERITTSRSYINGGNKYQCSINDESSHTTATAIDDEMESVVGEEDAPKSPVCVSVTPEQDQDCNSRVFLDDDDDDEDHQEDTNDCPKNTKSKRNRSVSFHETVTVVTIPNKDSYSDRIRKYLWAGPHERMQNTQRNVIEFSSENWDWRQAADDVEFYLCPVTGEKIHPCHNTYDYQESLTCYRPMSQHPFFEKSRQAAIAWENDDSRYTFSFR